METTFSQSVWSNARSDVGAGAAATAAGVFGDIVALAKNLLHT